MPPVPPPVVPGAGVAPPPSVVGATGVVVVGATGVVVVGAAGAVVPPPAASPPLPVVSLTFDVSPQTLKPNRSAACCASAEAWSIVVVSSVIEASSLRSVAVARSS